jgi:hypothetical protein
MVRSTSQHRTKWALAISNPVLQHPKGKMTSQTPSSVAERRLAIARRLYSALIAQNPDWKITLSDAGGRLIARHDPRSEESALEITT